MTHYIGDVPITSIQEVDKSIGQEVDELDIISEDSNILLNGSSEVEEIEIKFTLLKRTHPEKQNVQDQRSELKEMASREVSENNFSYDDVEYFLAIEDISIPESSDLQTVREGTITAKALPWPKNLSQEEIGVQKRGSGDVLLDFSIEGLPYNARKTMGEFSYQFIINSSSERVRGIDSEIDYNFFLEEVINKIKNTIGLFSFEADIKADSNEQKSNEANAEYSFSFRRLDSESFGRDFGRFFGSNENIYSLVLYALRSIISDIELSFDIVGEGLSARILKSDLSLYKNFDGDLNEYASSKGYVNYNLLSSDVLIDMKHSSVGCWQFFLYSDGDASIEKNNSGEIYTSLLFDSESSIELSKRGGIDTRLQMNGGTNKNIFIDSIILKKFNINGENSILYSGMGLLNSNLSLEGNTIRVRRFDAVIKCLMTVLAEGNIITSDDGNVDYSFNLSGEVDVEYGPFGKHFGRSFGGS